MSPTNSTELAARIASIELELATMPRARRTNQRREALERELARLDDLIENGPVPSYLLHEDPLYRGTAKREA
jgi:hypothetical protein